MAMMVRVGSRDVVVVVVVVVAVVVVAVVDSSDGVRLRSRNLVQTYHTLRVGR
jgi:hypothetical protein